MDRASFRFALVSSQGGRGSRPDIAAVRGWDIVPAGRDPDAMARYQLCVGRVPAGDPRAVGGVMRYKTWRSRNDTHLRVLCVEGSEAFEPLPVAIRNLDPWTGGPEGEIAKLRLPYRILLNEQIFVVVHAHISQLQLEATRAQELHPANTDCPECRARVRCRNMVGCGRRHARAAMAAVGSRGRPGGRVKRPRPHSPAVPVSWP